MYDTVKFIIQESDLNNEVCFMEEVACRISVKSSSSNEVTGYLDNMKVEIKGTTLIVIGSLLKYYQGNNYNSYLSRWKTKMVIDKLSKALGVPMKKAKVTRIDIGFCYNLESPVQLYLSRLLYEDGYFRSQIKKETVYFEKHDTTLCFYDKIAEMKKRKETANVEELKDLNIINLLRYEFRFKKVSKIFGRTIKGEDLYDPAFASSALDIWYNCYTNIQKGFDAELSAIGFYGKKDFKLFCVTFTMKNLDLFSALEEAFVKGDITSKNKFDIKEVIKEAELLVTDKWNGQNLIDELTVKIDNTYNNVKKDFERPLRRLGNH